MNMSYFGLGDASSAYGEDENPLDVVPQPNSATERPWTDHYLNTSLEEEVWVLPADLHPMQGHWDAFQRATEARERAAREENGDWSMEDDVNDAAVRRRRREAALQARRRREQEAAMDAAGDELMAHYRRVPTEATLSATVAQRLREFRESDMNACRAFMAHFANAREASESQVRRLQILTWYTRVPDAVRVAVDELCSHQLQEHVLRYQLARAQGSVDRYSEEDHVAYRRRFQPRFGFEDDIYRFSLEYFATRNTCGPAARLTHIRANFQARKVRLQQAERSSRFPEKDWEDSLECKMAMWCFDGQKYLLQHGVRVSNPANRAERDYSRDVRLWGGEQLFAAQDVHAQTFAAELAVYQVVLRAVHRKVGPLADKIREIEEGKQELDDQLEDFDEDEELPADLREAMRLVHEEEMKLPRLRAEIEEALHAV